MHPIDSIRTSGRGVARAIAGQLDHLTGGRITPSFVTVVGVAIHVPIAYLIAQGDFVVAGILVIIVGLTDILDGELARLQKVASPYGMVLDATTDRLKEFLLYGGIAYWLSTTGQAEWAIFAVLAPGLATTVTYAKAKGEVALAVQKKLFDHHKLNRHFTEGLIAYDVRIGWVALGLLLNQIIAAIVLVTILSTIMFFAILTTIKRQLKQ